MSEVGIKTRGGTSKGQCKPTWAIKSSCTRMLDNMDLWIFRVKYEMSQGRKHRLHLHVP